MNDADPIPEGAATIIWEYPLPRYPASTDYSNNLPELHSGAARTTHKLDNHSVELTSPSYKSKDGAIFP
jgi:hypothetical protein